MGYQANYHARNFARGSKALIRVRATGADGVMRCADCARAVKAGEFAYDHIIAWELSRYSGPSNGQILCTVGTPAAPSCHAIKTGTRDMPAIAKTRRLRRGRKVPRHPLPCGRASRWSKPMHGRPVRRIGSEAKHRATMTARHIMIETAEA